MNIYMYMWMMSSDRRKIDVTKLFDNLMVLLLKLKWSKNLIFIKEGNIPHHV